MSNGFTKGLFIGSIIGASISMMMDPGMIKGRGRKRMMRAGKSLMRRSGEVIGDVVDIFR